MATAKKKVTKKKVVKKKVASKKAVKKTAAPEKQIKAIKDAFTKTQLYAHISEETGVARKEAAKGFESLGEASKGQGKSRGAGEFKVPGLLKIKAGQEPATEARKYVHHPCRPRAFIEVEAKPARKVVKGLPVKALKMMADS